MAQKRRKKPSGIRSQLEASGLTQREFAEREGISTSTLTYWLRREKLEGEVSAQEETLAEIELPAVAVRTGYVVTLGDLRIEVPRDATDEEWQQLRRVWAS